MKKELFKKYTDQELRSIRLQLMGSYNTIHVSLPNEIKTYVEGKNALVGNQQTRVTRCIKLLDQECITRFLAQ